MFVLSRTLEKKTPSVRRLQQYEPLKLRAKGRMIVGCYMLRPLAHPVACCVLLGVVARSLKPASANGRNIVSQQLPTFLGVVASVYLSLTFQKENRRADLRLTEKLLLPGPLLNITIPWKLRVNSAQPVFGDELESPPSANQIFSFWLVTITGH